MGRGAVYAGLHPRVHTLAISLARPGSVAAGNDFDDFGPGYGGFGSPGLIRLGE